jgi:hypothetical protein
MKTGYTLNEQIEKQALISNINGMRAIIGLTQSDFNYLWRQTPETLREQQNSLIEHYNQAAKNANK